MSDDERAVLELSARGLVLGEVALALGWCRPRTRAVLARAIARLGASSKLEAIMIALRRGLIEPHPQGGTMPVTLTEDDFQRRYHDYMTEDRAAAVAEAEGILLPDGSRPVVVGLPFGPRVRYCLMVPSAARLLGRAFPDRDITTD